MNQKQRLLVLLELTFKILRVEFEHAYLIGDIQKAKDIVVTINNLLPTPFKLPEKDVSTDVAKSHEGSK